MSSSGAGRQGRLDASSGREVVYCHGCNNEWYKDEQPEETSLQCPSCHNEITEIVDPNQDPRPAYNPAPDSDSDPGEADIDEVHQGPHGFFGQRIVFATPGSRLPGGSSREPVDHNNEDATIARFREMLEAFGTEPPLNDDGSRRRREDRSGPRIRTRLTTVSVGRPGAGGGVVTTTRVESGDLFSAIFGNLLDEHQPEHHHHHHRHGAGNDDDDDPNAHGPMGPGTAMLQTLFRGFLSNDGVHGDAVFSQEALDRIITNLMDANPQSNAAPPASEAAINRLKKKQVDDAMLGPEGKAECTICIDELKKGDEVTELPCKHWFHGECVTQWLKEHNTCPVCRTPIENQDGGGSGSGGSGGDGNNDPQNRNDSSSTRHFQGHRDSPSSLPGGQASSSGFANSFVSSFFNASGARPGTQDEFASIRRIMRENERNPPEFYGGRRTSDSPPRPTARNPSDSAFLTRIRSPTTSRDQDADVAQNTNTNMGSRRFSSRVSRENQGDGSGSGGSRGAFDWLRNQFSRDSGSGSGGGGGSPGSSRRQGSRDT